MKYFQICIQMKAKRWGILSYIRIYEEFGSITQKIHLKKNIS